MADTPASPAPTDPALAAALAAAQLAKAQAEARSAGAGAETAEANARTAVAKAFFGEVPSAPYTGAVTTSETAALAEHNLLARQALIKLATIIASNAAARITGSNVFVTCDDAGPSRLAAEGFALHRQLVEQALDGAIALSRQLDQGRPLPEAGRRDVLPILPVLPLVLSGLNAALSYARSDHAIGGRELQPGDRTLVTAVAHELIKARKNVRIDGPPAPVPDPVRSTLVQELTSLATLASEARARAGRHGAVIQALTPKPAPLPSPPPADALLPADPDPDNQRPLHEEALGALKGAVKLFDELETSLLTVTDGLSGIARIAAARALAAFLNQADSAILVVKLDGAFGSTLSSKSLLKSVFGELPYKLSVQVQANWRCFDAGNTVLLGAAIEAHHVAFTDLDNIR